MISCHGSIRFDNDELCGVLFGWADAKLELVAEADPIDKGWVREVQGRRGGSADRPLGWPLRRARR